MPNNWSAWSAGSINLLKIGVSMIEIGEKDQGCKMLLGVKLQYPLAKKNIIRKAETTAKQYECKNVNNNLISDESIIVESDAEFLIKSKQEAENKIAKENVDLEEEKRKIAEEKRKIAEEKKKIAEAKKKQEEEEKQRKEANAKLYIIGSGTGFFVSSEGHIVSNDHVVGICRKVASKIDGKLEYFNIVKTDEINDLGLIKGEYKSPNYLSVKTEGAEYGEDIVAFGYPLSDDLSDSVKLTRGCS